MACSEEKRVAEEIIYELENSEKWSVDRTHGHGFDFSNNENRYGPKLIVLTVREKRWYRPLGGTVRMDEPLGFKFSSEIGRKLSKAIYKYVNGAKKREAKRKSAADIFSLKELYSNPKDGMLYVKDKKEIK
ncbi:hypothetical protein DRO61_07835 [Candidatus Bathyarchaeota archaeon]|nr:MAG: hypothetical protein DRO61_07835 [Candidatus Bathyarchaeota archaeon]